MRGIKINSDKSTSLENSVVDFSNPKKVYVALINGNTLCKPVIKVGKKVKKGTVIGIREDINFPILSPVSGVVTDIKPHLHSSGKEVDCVIIDNDLKDTLINNEVVEDINKYTKDEFVELLRTCSIVGMGGSDFPTFLKYKSDINTLIVNACECEPYLTSDSMISILKSETILDTMSAIMKINKIKEGYIVLKHNNRKVYDAFKKYIDNYPNIKIKLSLNYYPAGYERNVVKCALNKTYDKYPSEIGVVVNNVNTIFSIYKALKFKRNTTRRIITISGDGVSNPLNILVKTGSNMRKIIEEIGEYKKNAYIIAGGPMMGKRLTSIDFVISNNLSGITFIEKVKCDKQDCISCGRCVNICPMKLNPIMIRENIKDKDMLNKLNPKKCIECGLCSYVCPSKIDLTESVVEAKNA